MLNLIANKRQKYVSSDELKKEDSYICSLDPLQADERFQSVPTFNQQKDTIALVLMLVDILPSVQEAESMSYYEACAAMRDLGILLGSMKRHGVEPVDVIPELELKLNILGEKTDLPPRDTLIHYVRWNPEGRRQRTYTGTEDEKQLIRSVKVAIHPLHEAILLLHSLYDISIQSPEFKLICEAVCDNFEGMVKGMVNAKRNVSPKYFAEELRFYFDPITLNNREYLGPGAVEMPVFVFDHILWNCDLKDEDYEGFKKAYLAYNQMDMRELYDRYVYFPSLVNKCVNELNEAAGYSAICHENIRQLIRLFNLQKSFRAPHKKIADEAYEHAAKAEFRDKGSGGYHPSILQDILHHNLNALDRLKNALEAYTNKYFQAQQ